MATTPTTIETWDQQIAEEEAATIDCYFAFVGWYGPQIDQEALRKAHQGDTDLQPPTHTCYEAAWLEAFEGAAAVELPNCPDLLDWAGDLVEHAAMRFAERQLRQPVSS